MKTPITRTSRLRLTRRLWFTMPLASGIAWLFGGIRWAVAQQAQKASLLAKAVPQIPDDPHHALWQGSDALDVPLSPQAVVKPRRYDIGIKLVTARALYDENRLALLLTWPDASRNARIGSPDTFRDAIAVEFPAEPAAGIPYFGMGEPDRPVVIYQWKSDWQFPGEGDEEGEHPAMAVDWYPFSGEPAGTIATAADYAKTGDRAFITSWQAGSLLGDRDLQTRTTVEKLGAEGFGTLTALPPDRQDASGKAVWNEGVWSLLLSLPRAQDRFSFTPGMTVPVAFAAWDGSRRERGGEKAVSTWYFLSLEKPIGTAAYASPAIAFAGIAAIQVWLLSRLRRRMPPGAGKDV